MQKTRHYPPSQIKYQIEHPPVTVHLNTKLKEILDAVKGQRAYAQVISDIIDEKLNIQDEIKRLPLNEAVISYARGFEEAEERYAQLGTCIKCKGEDNYLWTDGKCDKCHGRTEGPDFSHFRDKVPVTWIEETDFEKAKVKLPNLEKLSYDNGYNRGFKEGRDVGYILGYHEAEEEFKITYPCSICGKPILVRPGSKSHKDIIAHMKEYGWAHSECLENNER